MRCCFVVAVGIALATCFAVSSATLGFDVNDLLSLESWQCMKDKGFEFTIISCFSSNGNPDVNCAQNVLNAKSTGLKVDIYMDHCPQCGSAKTQVQSLFNYTKTNNVQFDKLWVYVEEPYLWFNSTTDNRRYLTLLIHAVMDIFGEKKLGGIFTNDNYWEKIVGLKWKKWSNLPLWWDYFDGEPSFDDFTPFAGWNEPTMKGYSVVTPVFPYCDMRIFGRDYKK